MKTLDIAFELDSVNTRFLAHWNEQVREASSAAILSAGMTTGGIGFGGVALKSGMGAAMVSGPLTGATIGLLYCIFACYEWEKSKSQVDQLLIGKSDSNKACARMLLIDMSRETGFQGYMEPH